MRNVSSASDLAAATRAIDAIAGAAVVLDARGRVRFATPEAEALLGEPITRGQGSKALFGDFEVGASSVVTLAGGRTLRARAVALGRGEGEALVLLDEARVAEAQGAVKFHGMWTSTASMKEVFRVIERVALEDVPVLVRGETGSGKELVAHAIHALSSRRAGPFRAINCAAVPANLLESELFGHARGAFTGAVRDAPGHVQLAHGGTLFLDEVADMPQELQAKLLRVLETRTVLPVGARSPVPVDVRFVSATHRSLRAEVSAGRFRADLMYRLRVIPIFLPPLRERRQDVALLVSRILEETNVTRGKRRRIEHVSPAARAVLLAYDFPGNVRELKNVLAYAYATGDGVTLMPSDLPPELSQPSEPKPEVASRAALDATNASNASNATEVTKVTRALERAGGNRERAAKLLGVSRITLWRHMRELGIEVPRSRLKRGPHA